MYEHFTDRSRRVMQLANRFAMSVNHEYIGTEHILVGLFEESSGVASHVLRNLFPGIDIKQEVLKIIRPGPDMLMVGRLPLTPASKSLVEKAMECARHMGDKFIGTEHLLLGSICDYGNAASHVLTALGKNVEDVRSEVIAVLGAQPDSKLVENALIDTKKDAVAPGLTDAEKSALEKITDFWNSYMALPDATEDAPAVCNAVHSIQAIIAIRVARRVNPETWR